MKNRSQTAVLTLTLLVILGITLWLSDVIIKKNNGQFTYILDDAYIHMAMAKNIAEHGVWGISPYGFTSSSSSPLWTALLAMARKAGMSAQFSPLIFNLIFALLAFSTFYILLKNEGSPFWPSLFGAILLFFLSPFLYLIFSGLEHGLHCWISLLYLSLAAHFLLKPSTKLLSGLLLISLILPMIRYEGLFLIASLVLFLSLSKRFGEALLILASSLLSVTAYGLFSLSKGWYFLPNSVFLKGNRIDSLSGFFSFLAKGLEQIRLNSHLLIGVLLLLLLTLVYWKRFSLRDKALVFLFLSTYLQHMFFARSGEFVHYPYLVRYDAYLTLSALFILIVLAKSHLPRPQIQIREPLHATYFLLLALLVSAPFISRFLNMSRAIPPAANDLYRQQYQIARFIGEHYKGENVALNDIGYPSFANDLYLTDLLALADKEMGDLILSNRYAPQTVDTVLRRRKVKAIIMFEPLFTFVTGKGRPPASWIKVGSWYMPHNTMSAYPIVSFFALDTETAAKLEYALSDFNPSLPTGVQAQLRRNLIP